MSFELSREFKIHYSGTHVKEYSRLGDISSYCIYLFLRGRYKSGHYHCKQDVPEWFGKSLQSWYRALKKMHDVGLINLGRNGKGYKLRTMRHGLEPNKKGKFSYKKIFVGSLQELVDCFKRFAIIKNLGSQIKKRVYKKFKVTKGSNNSKAKMKAVRLELRQVGKICVDTLLQPGHAYNTFMSCRKAGELIGRSAWSGKNLLNKLIGEGMIKRKVTYVDKGDYRPDQVKHAMGRIREMSKYPLIVGKYLNREGKVKLIQKVVTVSEVRTVDVVRAKEILFECKEVEKK